MKKWHAITWDVGTCGTEGPWPPNFLANYAKVPLPNPKPFRALTIYGNGHVPPFWPGPHVLAASYLLGYNTVTDSRKALKCTFQLIFQWENRLSMKFQNIILWLTWYQILVWKKDVGKTFGYNARVLAFHIHILAIKAMFNYKGSVP